MSRRYGRQRKRESQARIAYLESELARSRKQEAVTREALWIQQAELRRLISEIEEVCPNSALLPPKDLGFEPSGFLVRLPLTRRLGPWLPEKKVSPIEYPVVEFVDVHEVRVVIERDLSRFQRTVHVTYPRGQGWGYAISDQAWRHFARKGLHEVLIMMMSMLMRSVRDSEERRLG